jgi:hypothetical protein
MSSIPESFGMQLICSRNIPFIDCETLSLRIGREALFRKNSRFILYTSDGEPASSAQERIVNLSVREALIWLNEDVEDAETFW